MHNGRRSKRRSMLEPRGKELAAEGEVDGTAVILIDGNQVQLHPRVAEIARQLAKYQQEIVTHPVGEVTFRFSGRKIVSNLKVSLGTSKSP